MEHYQYKPLGEDDIRLIKFGPNSDTSLELMHYNLSSDPVEYIALSYCWGDLTSTREISTSQGKLQITQSLWDALDEIRRHVHDVQPEVALIWIDQICINQEDVQERNQQVHHMWRIFSSARLVFAWLGHETEELPSARLVVSSRGQNTGGTRSVAGPDSGYGHDRNSATDPASQQQWDPLRPAAKELKAFDVPYFSRCWIVPEILQARRLIFLVGSHAYPAKEFEAKAEKIVRDYKVGYDTNFLRTRQVLQTRIQRHTQPKPSREFSQTVTEYSIFLDALKLLHGTECSDVRDRIFAALSNPTITTGAPRLALRPDYRLTPDELVVVVVSHLDKLEGYWKPPGETARTLASSMMLCGGVTLTDVCELSIVKAIESSTDPWVRSKVLFLKSGTEIGRPGPLMKYFLTRRAE